MLIMMLIMVLGHDLVGQSLSRMMQKNVRMKSTFMMIMRIIVKNIDVQ